MKWPGRRWRCWLRWGSGIMALWLLALSSWIVYVGYHDQAAPSDAIIVLGAAAYDARPSPVFEERIRHAIYLYQSGYAPRLIFTGGFGGAKARFAESQVARGYALRQGVPASAILIETRSRTTRQNLLEAKQLMAEQGIDQVIVVSDPLHMARALRLSRKLDIQARGSATPSSRFRSLRTRLHFLIKEVWFFHRDLFLHVE